MFTRHEKKRKQREHVRVRTELRPPFVARIEKSRLGLSSHDTNTKFITLPLTFPYKDPSGEHIY